MKHIVIMIAAFAVLGATASPAAAGLTPQKVVGGPGSQYWPSSNGTYVAWSDGRNRLARIFVMDPGTGTRAKVNRPGSDSNLGPSSKEPTSWSIRSIRAQDRTCTSTMLAVAIGARRPGQ